MTLKYLRRKIHRYKNLMLESLHIQDEISYYYWKTQLEFIYKRVIEEITRQRRQTINFVVLNNYLMNQV